MSATATPTTIHDLVRSLGRFPRQVLPEGVMREIMAYGAAANEVLLDRLDHGINNVHGGLGAVPPECFFCYALLHTHPDIRMLATVQRLFELEALDAERIVGELRTEFTPALLLNMTTEANQAEILEWIDGLLRNPKVDVFNQWALVKLPACWFHRGLMTRDRAIDQLKTWMVARSELKHDDLSAACVCELLDLNAYEEKEFLRDCFERGQIASEIVSSDETTRQLSSDCLPTESESFDKIEDLVDYLSQWEAFKHTSASLNHNDTNLTPIRRHSLWDRAEEPAESQIEEWFAAIRKSDDKYYPQEAVRRLTKHASLVADRLVDEVRWGLQRCGTENARDSNGPFLAATILAAQHSGPGKEVLLDLLDLPPDQQMDIVGDAMLSSIVYTLSHRLLGDCEPIDQRIADVDRDDVDRALLAMFYPLSVDHGFLTRDEGIAKLLDLMERFVDESLDLANGIYDALCLMSLPDDHPVMCAAREKGVSNLFLEEDDARRCIESPMEASDIIRETTKMIRIPELSIQSSVMFNPDALSPPPRRPAATHSPPTLNNSDLPGTIRNTANARIPRNSPCPCGSGKKYKKCCQKKQN